MIINFSTANQLVNRKNSISFMDIMTFNYLDFAF